MASKIHRLSTPVDLAKTQYGQYYANVYKDGEFVVGIHFENHSGNMAMEEVRYLRNNEFPTSQGYTIDW